MKIPRIVAYIALGFVISSVFYLFFGSGGLLEYRRLQIYQGSVEQNIEDLAHINNELLSEVQALGSDPERLTLQARELGYFREGEKIIRLSGHQRGRRYYTVGKILRRKPKTPRSDWPFKVAGLGLPFLLGFVSISVRRRKNRETGNR
jgi:cell division protein FtsB